MRIDAVVVPRPGTDEVAEVVLDDVEAGHVQPGMLVYNEELNELFALDGDPVAFHHERYPGARIERWMRIRLVGVDVPLELHATDRVDVVYGAELVQALAPMLEPDLLDEQQEALAFNGMCHEQIPVGPGDQDGDEAELVVYCGRPSDPDSYYRFCTGCDTHRREESTLFTGRQYGPTYGAISTP